MLNWNVKNEKLIALSVRACDIRIGYVDGMCFAIHFVIFMNFTCRIFEEKKLSRFTEITKIIIKICGAIQNEKKRHEQQQDSYKENSIFVVGEVLTNRQLFK